MGFLEQMMSQFPTSFENIALSLIFKSLGASCAPQTIDQYIEMAARAPKLIALHADVNRLLQQIANSGAASSEICRFKAGDECWSYELFPTSLSLEVVRSAWVKSGMRELQKIAREQARTTPQPSA
jgi:hypothetical protein